MENQNLSAIMAHAVETEYRQADRSANMPEESTPAHAPALKGFSWQKIWRKFGKEKGAARVGESRQSLR